MIQFILYGNNQTPTPTQSQDAPVFSRLTPYLYIGNTDGREFFNYDPQDENTLKHLKISVASVDNNEPMLSLDTLDLYKDYDHKINGITDAALSEKIQTLSSSCPIRFQRVHFLGTTNGTTREYHSIVLIGSPVPVTDGETSYHDNSPEIWSPGYAGSEGEYLNRLIIGASGLGISGISGIKTTDPSVGFQFTPIGNNLLQMVTIGGVAGEDILIREGENGATWSNLENLVNDIIDGSTPATPECDQSLHPSDATAENNPTWGGWPHDTYGGGGEGHNPSWGAYVGLEEEWGDSHQSDAECYTSGPH